MKRSFLVLGLSVFAVFGSGVAGFPGSGGLCTLVLAFLASLGWGTEKVITCTCQLCTQICPKEMAEPDSEPLKMSGKLCFTSTTDKHMQMF